MSVPTTVTMDVTRFKVLEAKEQAFDDYVNGKDILLIKVPYGSEYLYSATLSEVMAKIEAEVKRVSEYAEKWRQEALKSK